MNAPRNLLLIDIGNTRIKWRYVEATWSSSDRHGVATADEAIRLGAMWSKFAIAHVSIANVAGDRALASVLAALRETADSRSHSMTISVLQPSRMQAGVVNCYRDPERLGADRWAALIGARALQTGSGSKASSLIVSLGTATTIDLLLSDGRFAGGVILPGIATMHRSLAVHTAQLPLVETAMANRHDAVDSPDLADNTEDAIASGVLHAQAGAIERMWARAQSVAALESPALEDATLECLMSGGDAARIAPLLPFPVRIEEQLVLRGLYRIAIEDARIASASPPDAPRPSLS